MLNLWHQRWIEVAAARAPRRRAPAEAAPSCGDADGRSTASSSRACSTPPGRAACAGARPCGGCAISSRRSGGSLRRAARRSRRARCGGCCATPTTTSRTTAGASTRRASRPSDMRERGRSRASCRSWGARRRATPSPERTPPRAPPSRSARAPAARMGRPLVFGYERSSEYWRHAMKLRGYGWAGYRPGQRSLHFWGAGPPAPAGARRRRWQRGCATLKVKPTAPCAASTTSTAAGAAPPSWTPSSTSIRREQPEVIVCYSQAGADLARHVIARGAARLGRHPRAVRRRAPAARRPRGARAGVRPAGVRDLRLPRGDADGHRVRRRTTACTRRWRRWSSRSSCAKADGGRARGAARRARRGGDHRSHQPAPCRSSATPTATWRCRPSRDRAPAGAPCPAWPRSRGA